MTRPGPRTLLIGAAVFVTYVLTARFGFSYALVAEQVTTVWAPTGLAQAVLLLWGRRLWPAIWIGAFARPVGIALFGVVLLIGFQRYRQAMYRRGPDLDRGPMTIRP